MKISLNWNISFPWEKLIHPTNFNACNISTYPSFHLFFIFYLKKKLEIDVPNVLLYILHAWKQPNLKGFVVVQKPVKLAAGQERRRCDGHLLGAVSAGGIVNTSSGDATAVKNRQLELISWSSPTHPTQISPDPSTPYPQPWKSRPKLPLGTDIGGPSTADCWSKQSHGRNRGPWEDESEGGGWGWVQRRRSRRKGGWGWHGGCREEWQHSRRRGRRRWQRRRCRATGGYVSRARRSRPPICPNPAASPSLPSFSAIAGIPPLACHHWASRKRLRWSWEEDEVVSNGVDGLRQGEGGGELPWSSSNGRVRKMTGLVCVGEGGGQTTNSWVPYNVTYVRVILGFSFFFKKIKRLRYE